MASSSPLSVLRSIDKKSFHAEAERRSAVAEAYSLINRLETPWETLFRHVWIHPTLMAAIETAQDLDLFKKWNAAGATKKTEQELRQLVSCDADLFGRILRHLAAGGVLTIDDAGVFAPTDLSIALSGDKIGAAAHFFYEINMPAFLTLPEYLKSLKHQEPSTGSGNWKFGHGEEMWAWLKTNPRADRTIGLVMAAHATHRVPLMDIYPTDQLVANNTNAEVLVVDVGGGIGHDLEAFNKRYPQSSGRLILQDRREVIETVKTNAAIKVMVHDFMTPNPVHGASVYYLHYVLHDWLDKDAVRILEALKSSMKKDVSKVLVHEIVVSTKKPNLQATTQDITMMGMGAARERTEQDWRQVFDNAGYKINGIWSEPLNNESVIEIEPA